MDYRGGRIADITKEFIGANTKPLPENLSEQELYLFLEKRAAHNCELMSENISSIDIYLKPLQENPQAVSDACAKQYFNLAQTLYDKSCNVDAGLSLTIHKALLKRARALNNDEEIIKELYWLGLIDMFFYRYMFVESAEKCFEEILTVYMPKYFELESSETRLYFLRSFANYTAVLSQKRHICKLEEIEKVFDDYIKACSEWQSFQQRADVRAKDPHFPWDAFEKNMHQNICAWMDTLNNGFQKNCGTLANNKLVARTVYDSVCHLYVSKEHSEDWLQNERFWSTSRTAYLYYTSRYHINLSTLKEVVESLRQLTIQADLSEYSYDAVYKIMHVSTVLMQYLSKADFVNKQQREKEEEFLTERLFAYYKNFPGADCGVDLNTLNTHLLNFLRFCTPGYERANKLFEQVLRITSFSHMSTYVHSVMVSKIMECIAEHFFKTEPVLFAGISHAKTEQEILKNKAEIIDIVRLAGYAHDAGKIEYINTISIYSRKLIDREFEMIKQHPEYGCMLLQQSAPKAVLDVSIGHHKWYDGSKGYPQSFNNTTSAYKFLIDICSVADSIDAATDELGRSYTTAKKLATVVDEIKAGAGSIYSPKIAKALEDENLIKQIENILNNQRSKIYHEAYCGKQIELPVFSRQSM